MPPQDDENIRPGEPSRREPSRGEPSPRRRGRGSPADREMSRADRMERRRNRYHDYDQLPMEDLRAVAFYQKVLLLCVLAMMVLYFSIGAVSVMAQESAKAGRTDGALLVPLFVLIAAFAATGIAATVFVFLLSIKVYNVVVGILLGLLVLVPCLNVLVLVIINGHATTVLRRNGVYVGFLGARKRDLDDLEAAEQDADDGGER